MKFRKAYYRNIDKIMRHGYIFLTNMNFQKGLNLLILLLNYVTRKKKVIGYPAFLKIEPSSICNLKCLGCRSGKHTIDLEKGVMHLDIYKKIIDEIGDYLVEIGFYLWGEPCINKELTEMISIASNKRIGSVVSANMHFLNEEMAIKLLDAKLKKLIVAVDGVTQEEYEKVRIDGNLEKVMANLQFIANEKKRRKSKYPIIEWQYVATETNKHQIDEARKIADNLGIDVFNVLVDWYDRKDDKKVKDERMKAHTKRKTTCHWPWFAFAIQFNGDVYPCCHTAKKTTWRFDNMKDKSIKSIWNSPIYVESRGKFSFIQKVEKSRSICFRCPLV